MIVEHRDYVRVDDRLVVSWRPVESQAPVDDELRDIMIMSVNRQINDMMAVVETEHPQLAKLLMHLNHKIDLLADQRADASYGPSLVRVNISRTGMAFDWKTDVAIGSDIRIWLTLPPENTKLMVRATVLACDRTGDRGRPRVRCQFHNKQVEALDAISSYIDYVLDGRDVPNRLKAPVKIHGGVNESEVVPLRAAHQQVLFYR